MTKPTEHKTVQARIIEYAEAIGWTFVSQKEAEDRRGGIPAPQIQENGGWRTPTPFSTRTPKSTSPRIAYRTGIIAVGYKVNSERADH